MKEPLTKKQKETLVYITKCIKKNGYAPSLEEMKNYFSLKSFCSIWQRVYWLEDKGYIKKVKYRARSIIILIDN